MLHWGFWEWLAYSVTFAAAILLATDAGIKQSVEMRIKFKGLIDNRYWGFTPLALMLVGGTIFLARTILGTHDLPQQADVAAHSQVKTIEQDHPDAPLEKTKGPYDDVSNNDLKLVARELSNKIDQLLRDKYRKEDENRKLNPTDRAKADLIDEDELSRNFRNTFGTDVTGISREIAERINNRSAAIILPTGQIGIGFIIGTQNDLTYYASRLP